MSKILLMADWYLPHAGGSRVYYHNLYSRLATDHDQVTVLTKRVPGGESFDSEHSNGALRIVRRSTPLPSLSAKHLWRIALPLYEAGWRSLRGQVDIVHAGDLCPPGAIALLMKRLGGLPYIAYCHGEDITLTEIRRFQRPLRNSIYGQADAVVAACEFARQKLLEIGIPCGKITKITPGVDAERFQPRPADIDLMWNLGLENKRVLLTIARLVPRKGHASVLRAFAQIQGRVPNAVYVIAGTGPERAQLEQLSRDLGIAERVRFVGYVPDDRLASYYNLCDVFLMMNQETDGDIEGFGMVFLEASASGKVVLGGKSGGTADSIVDGSTGFLLNPLDTESLAAKLEWLLLNDEARRAIGEAGMLRARRDFSWNSRAETLRALSNEVIKRKHLLPVSSALDIGIHGPTAVDDKARTEAAV
jgi:phosphatidyl-myo-inositol dimannoside synthase